MYVPVTVVRDGQTKSVCPGVCVNGIPLYWKSPNTQYTLSRSQLGYCDREEGRVQISQTNPIVMYLPVIVSLPFSCGACHPFAVVVSCALCPKYTYTYVICIAPLI